MSENAGLDTGEPEKTPNVVLQQRNKVWSAIIERPPQVWENVEVHQQRGMEDLRYSPFMRGQMKLSSYRSVPLPPRERFLKRNPILPAVSFIPRSTTLPESVLINNPAYSETKNNLSQQTIEDSLKPAQDMTFGNNIVEQRSMPILGEEGRLLRMVKERERYIRQGRGRIDRLIPDAPKIVDVKKHRARHIKSSAVGDTSIKNAHDLFNSLVLSKNKKGSINTSLPFPAKPPRN